MKPLLKIGIYFVITFVLTIILSIIQQLLGVRTDIISMPQFGPGLAAIVMILIFKRDGVKFRFTFKGLRFSNLLASIAIPLIIPILLFILYNQLFGTISAPPIDIVSLTILLGGILLGAVGEEIGWRGYAQNLLERDFNRLIAFMIVGVLWGIWHIGNFQNGVAFMFFFVLSTIGISAVMVWLLRGTKNNIILASLFHFSVNFGYYILQDAITDLRLMALNGLVWVVVAAIIVAINRSYFLQGS